jgi:uncharacterized protein DUF6893
MVRQVRRVFRLAVLGAVIAYAVRSIPDLKRYRKMREM